MALEKELITVILLRLVRRRYERGVGLFIVIYRAQEWRRLHKEELMICTPRPIMCG